MTTTEKDTKPKVDKVDTTVEIPQNDVQRSEASMPVVVQDTWPQKVRVTCFEEEIEVDQAEYNSLKGQGLLVLRDNK